MAHPDGYPALKAALDAAALRIRKERITTIWVPRKEAVDERAKRVTVSGRLKTFISDRLTSERNKDYIVEFTITASGRLYVSKIEEVAKRGAAANR
jgi:conjugal transfer pilus assembly protein TraE